MLNEKPDHLKKILVLSDLHVPKTRLDLLERILDQEADSDCVVIAGDLFDCQSIGYFAKDHIIPLDEEYVMAYSIIEEISNRFPEVIVFEGNHGKRWKRQILNLVPHVARFLLEKPLTKRIVDGEFFHIEEKEWEQRGKMRNVRCPMVSRSETSWYYRLGHTIFAHPEKHSKLPGRVVEQAYDYFTKRGHIDIDCVIIGHLHKLNMHYTYNALLIENGCLCEAAAYSDSPKMGYTPQVNGYTVIYQDEDGRLDRELSGIKYLDSTVPHMYDEP